MAGWLYAEMGKLLFKSNSLLITITCNKKYFVTVTYYLENKVTVIILHIIHITFSAIL